MHLEKNQCESIIFTLLHVKDKTKDGMNAHKDLVDIRIRKYLNSRKKGKKTFLPLSPYALSKQRNIYLARGYSI